MSYFRLFIENHNQIDQLVNEFNNPLPQTGTIPIGSNNPPQAGPIPVTTTNPLPQTGTTPVVANKPWSAKKAEIIQLWKNLRTDVPIIISPLSDQLENPNTEKSTYGEDGIRISGSWAFITSILAKIKELIYYENPQTKLRLVFRGVDKNKAIASKQAFVFYLNLERRSRGKPGRPKS